MIDLDSFYLHAGAGMTEEEACLIQRAALLHATEHGYADRLPIEAVFVDRPCWLNRAINAVAVSVNDLCDDITRQQLKPLLIRILNCTQRSPVMEARINERMQISELRRALPLCKDQEIVAACEQAIKLVEMRLATEETTELSIQADDLIVRIGALRSMRRTARTSDTRAEGKAHEMLLVQALSMLGQSDYESVFLAGVQFASHQADADLVEWLTETLDAWEKAVAEEGALLDDEADKLVEELVEFYERETAAEKAMLVQVTNEAPPTHISESHMHIEVS